MGKKSGFITAIHPDYKIRDKISLMRIHCETGLNFATPEAKEEAIKAIDMLMYEIHNIVHENGEFYKKLLTT